MQIIEIKESKTRHKRKRSCPVIYITPVYWLRKGLIYSCLVYDINSLSLSLSLSPISLIPNQTTNIIERLLNTQSSTCLSTLITFVFFLASTQYSVRWPSMRPSKGLMPQLMMMSAIRDQIWRQIVNWQCRGISQPRRRHMSCSAASERSR